MTKFILVVSVAAAALYATAAYKILPSDSAVAKGLGKFGHSNQKLADYGTLRYLTNQCLLAQLLNAFLHALVALLPRSTLLRGSRDLLYSASALPLSILVASTFWAVYAFDRELIFPRSFASFFPSWLNHSVHTLIVPINICFALLDAHKYRKLGVVLLLGHLLGYLALLINIKSKTGSYVYPYLDALGGEMQVYAYFAATALLLLLIYKFGELFTFAVQPDSFKQEDASKKHK